MSLLTRFRARFGYLHFVDNWHKARPISWLMCKLGRHDFEAEKVHIWQRATDLYCLYCPARKRSYHVNEGRGLDE